MDVTVLIPVLRSRKNEAWLNECITGFSAGTKYLVIENDGDLAEAMNQALAQVDTEWIVPFGHDDVPDDNFVETLLASGYGADVVYPTMVIADEELRPQGVFAADPFCGNRLQTWNFVSGAFLARTEMVRKVGGWRDLDTYEDWDLHVRMFKAGARFKACPAARMYYRQVTDSRNRVDRGFKSHRAVREHYQNLISTPPKVKATFYFQATPSVSYWRCILPARYLPGVATSDLSGVRKEGGGIDFLDHQGAAVFQFPGNNERAAALLAMQADGHKYIVEVDDNYLDEKDFLFRERAGWKLKINAGSPHSVQGHRWITENADGVIVTTRKLAEIYGEVNPNVHICRNSIDPTDWPELEKPDDGVFRIGWFASRSHDRDADLVRKALSWASRQPNVQVVTVGLDPAGWDFTRLHLPWSDDFGVYRRALQLLDVGVAPILRTSSAVCRSDLKALEYGMAGVLPVLQSMEPYEDWHHKPALMAATAKEFEEQIRWCVKNRDEAKAKALETRDYVIGNRTIQTEVKKWEKALA